MPDDPTKPTPTLRGDGHPHDEREGAPLTILYIAGWGRSGSTLVGSQLETTLGLPHLGEVWHLWRDHADPSALCSCREPYRDCAFWREVLRAANIDAAVLADMAATKARYLGTRQYLTRPAWRSDDLPAPLQRYGETLLRLYRAVAEATGAPGLIDASKTPTTIALLAQLAKHPTMDLHLRVLHLIRDPRAVAYSWWYRPKARGPTVAQGTMKRHSPLRSTLSWRARNVTVASLCEQQGIPRMEMRYEDFAVNATESLTRIQGFIGTGEHGSAAPAHQGHSVRGNAVRFDGSTQSVTLDERWRSELPSLWRHVVEWTAGRDLQRFGYERR